MDFLLNALLALGVGLLLGVVIIGGLWLMLGRSGRAALGERFARSGALDLLRADHLEVGSETDSDLRPLDLSDPDTRVLLGLRALTIYLHQGGDPDLLMLLPLSDEDGEALGAYATRRRRGY